MKSVRDIVRPFAKTELDKWIDSALGADRQGPPDDMALYSEVYRMEFWVEVMLTKPVRRAVFWPLTNFLSGLFRREFYGEDS